MKRILLTTTALVAFAGMAQAQQGDVMPVLDGAIVSDTGMVMADGDTQPSDIAMAPVSDTAPAGVALGADGEFGYNEEVEGGFYFEGGLGITTNAGMNMGLTAGITADVDIDFSDNELDAEGNGINDGGTFDNADVSISDFVIFVEGQGAGLYIGDTETAAATRWSGTTNMERDGFLEVGDIDDGAVDGDSVDGVIRADLDYNNFSGSVGFLLTQDGDNADLDGIDGFSMGINGTFGNFNAGVAYQEEVDAVIFDNGPIDEIVAVSAGTTFSGADVKLAYARNLTIEEDSLGFQVDYPFGPVTASAFYSFESLGDDNYGFGVAYASGAVSVGAYYHDGQDEEIGIEGSYDAGNGLIGYAGYIQNDGDSDAYEAYVAAAYELGGGASLIASYGDTGDAYTGANDEIGNTFEVNEGTTVAVSFQF
ncbi:porin [Loktanella fryxellensis]|uniref:Porin n=2 Tax=Loktanella fryxellensis TaxID=245187 RepID=A0A1H8HUW0_9RHOB|nr:porin [Loktanella fryxellensis]